uniref:Uncharacterized protein n=1 Tax=Ascaris lumbricoides TaxID=6252 RepID=A0A0M3HY38_ASCLU
MASTNHIPSEMMMPSESCCTLIEGDKHVHGIPQPTVVNPPAWKACVWYTFVFSSCSAGHLSVLSRPY